jgi:CheY-like chemotaxis protein/HPt (histidine-containing phosphotransfer) domain-containing protein
MVESKPVRRSSLYETLVQRKRGARPPEEPATDAEPVAAPQPPGRDQPLVLVAEDNEVNRLLAVRMLERRGYRVGLAANGREAVDAVAAGEYALVLMDCQMPELDGYEATRAIRAGEAERGKPRTPIVAMTANSMRGDRERCLAAGMDDYLAKPLDADAFDASLERWAPASDGCGPAAPAFDRDAFERLRDDLGESDLLAGLLDVFRSQTPEHLDALRVAVAQDDAAEAARVAHTLKGGAQTLAAARMASLCHKLEEMARGESLEGASGLVAGIEAAFGEATDALAAELAEAR